MGVTLAKRANKAQLRKHSRFVREREVKRITKSCSKKKAVVAAMIQLEHHRVLWGRRRRAKRVARRRRAGKAKAKGKRGKKGKAKGKRRGKKKKKKKAKAKAKSKK